MRYPSPVLIFILSILVILSLDSNSSLFAYGDSSIPVISYLEQVQANYDNYNDSLWSLGDNLQEGDYYSYKICNEDTIHQIIYPYHCYVISLEFVKLLESYNGDTWIVQSYFTIGDTIYDTIYDTVDYTIGDTIYDTIVNSNNTSPLILLIDPYTFHVSTDPFNRAIGDSIQNTIFSLSIYGEKSLSIGTVWDEIDSYFTNKIPLEIKNKQSIQIFTPSFTPNSSNDTSNYTSVEASVLSYDIIVPSNVYLHSDYPFPLKAKLYSPNIIYPEPQELYYYELLEYSRDQSGDYKFNNSVETIVKTTVETTDESIVDTIETTVETIVESIEGLGEK